MLRHADQVLGGGASAIVCGPGLGTATSAKALVARSIAERVPLVLDADALNAIAADPELAAAVARREAPTLRHLIPPRPRACSARTPQPFRRTGSVPRRRSRRGSTPR
jgi:hypothetical protein